MCTTLMLRKEALSLLPQADQAGAVWWHHCPLRSKRRSSPHSRSLPAARPTPQVFGFLRKHIHEEETVNEVKRMTLTADGQGAVFDVPTKLAKVGAPPSPST